VVLVIGGPFGDGLKSANSTLTVHLDGHPKPHRRSGRKFHHLRGRYLAPLGAGARSVGTAALTQDLPASDFRVAGLGPRTPSQGIPSGDVADSAGCPVSARWIAEWPTQLVGAADRAASGRCLRDAICSVDPRLSSSRSDFDATIMWHWARLDGLPKGGEILEMI